MKTQEIRELTLEEMGSKLELVQKQWVEMKMQFYSNPGAVKQSEFGKIKKTIARLITIQRERSLQVNSQRGK